MAVSENNVQAALTYLADDPHPRAIAKKALFDAEVNSKAVYSKEYQLADGPTETRKQIAYASEAHLAAKRAEGDALLEYERHIDRKGAAQNILDIWREENWNIRAAEKMR